MNVIVIRMAAPAGVESAPASCVDQELYEWQRAAQTAVWPQVKQCLMDQTCDPIGGPAHWYRYPHWEECRKSLKDALGDSEVLYAVAYHAPNSAQERIYHGMAFSLDGARAAVCLDGMGHRKEGE